MTTAESMRASHAEAGPLSFLRVVEVGSGIAVSYAGKLFADFGADVIRLEMHDASGSSPLDAQAAAYQSWLDGSKRLSAIGSDSDWSATLERLLPAADLLISGPLPADLERSLKYGVERASNASLAQVAISWFGESGPYARFAGSDSVCRALAGAVRSMGPIEGPPILPEDGHLSILAGTLAMVPLLASVLAGRGARYSLSIHEVGLLLSELETGQAMTDGLRRPRLGVNRFPRNFPSGPYRTADGWLGVTVATDQQWRSLCQLLELPELASDSRYATSQDRIRRADVLDAQFVPLFQRRTTNDWFAAARRLRLPLTPMPTVEELLDHPVLMARGAFGEVAHDGSRFAAPLAPLHLNGTPPARASRGPERTERTACRDLRWRERAPRVALGADWRREPPERSALPLGGVRIVDLTMGWAGPLATKLLADLGADVVKVESCSYPDWWRGKGSGAADAHEKNLWFHTMNRNKRGVTVDLKKGAGVRTLHKLLGSADAVIDNYASDVLPALGLDQDELARKYPRLVVESITCFGADSAWRDVRAYGTTMEQASGLPSMTGRPQDPPTMCHSAYGDPVAGVNAAAAMLVALVHKARTGSGQRVDLSAVECLLPLGAARIIEFSLSGRTGPRTGNRHPRRAPHGCFRCADEEWLVIDVQTDAQWAALCSALGAPELKADAGLQRAAGRLAAQDRIEHAIGEWTRTRDSDAAMAQLQAAGIAAGVARSPVDLGRDPHLVQRRYWQETEHRFQGRHLQPSAPFRLDSGPLPVRRPAPTLGEHSTSVLHELAGLSSDEISELEKQGVVGSRPITKSA
jgi:crotonobetainyl-CoA:carnitine CoA-transferase CaiB-like acyl-CoA transferase